MHWYANYPQSETFFSAMHNIDFSYPSHLHGCFEVSFCVRGEVTIAVAGQSESITAGKGILIPPNTIHSYQTNCKSDYYTILFSCRLLSDISALFSRKHPMRYTFSFKDKLIEHLLGFYSDQSLFGAKSVLYLMAEAFIKENRFIVKEKVDDDLTIKIISYIQENLCEQLTLSDLSNYLGYNYYYISKRVKQTFNMPFSSLLSQYRVAEAKNLLSSGKFSISQVALSCGFGSIRTFNRVFLKLTGQTPSQYLSARCSLNT